MKRKTDNYMTESHPCMKRDMECDDGWWYAYPKSIQIFLHTPGGQLSARISRADLARYLRKTA